MNQTVKPELKSPGRCITCREDITPENDGICYNEGSAEQQFLCNDCHYNEFGTYLWASSLYCASKLVEAGYIKTRKEVEYDDCGRPDTDPDFDPRDIDFKI